MMDTFQIVSVGIVRKKDKKVTIEIHEDYEQALLRLNQFSHIMVYYWFHKNDTPEKRNVLQVHPRGNKANPLTGVFATRSPVRPNPIGMSMCKILCIDGNIIYIDRIDAFNESWVIDIKPCISDIDAISDSKTPAWVRNSGVNLWNKVKK